MWRLGIKQGIPPLFRFTPLVAGAALLCLASIYPVFAKTSTFTQDHYRWYENRDDQEPYTPLGAEDTAIAGVVKGDVLRLRINVQVKGKELAADSQAFKLQYAASTSGPWTDVGAIGSTSAWRGYDNPTPVDGETLEKGSKLLTKTKDPESYEEENPSVANPRKIKKNKRGEWDWTLEAYAPTSGTTYYFRMVKSNGEVLSGYSRYPQLSTPGSTVTSNSGPGNPDTTVSYTNTITNAGQTADTFDITLHSSAGWTLGLYQADGTTPLPDTDGDGVPDTGSLGPGAWANIVVKVTVGWNTTTDVTTVTSTSSVDPQMSDTGTNTTTTPPTISVLVSDSTADFGTNASPGGEDSNSSDQVDDYQSVEGSYYVWRSSSGNGLSITVKSNQSWGGTVHASENSGTATSMTIASGALRYKDSLPTSYADCASATAFTTSSTTWQSNVGPGISTYNYYYCLRFDWVDTPGTFSSTVTYSASQ